MRMSPCGTHSSFDSVGGKLNSRVPVTLVKVESKSAVRGTRRSNWNLCFTPSGIYDQCLLSSVRCESPEPFLKASSQSRVTKTVVIAEVFLNISSALLWKNRKLLINEPTAESSIPAAGRQEWRDIPRSRAASYLDWTPPVGNPGAKAGASAVDFPIPFIERVFRPASPKSQEDSLVRLAPSAHVTYS